jgi:hypothetical protein
MQLETVHNLSLIQSHQFLHVSALLGQGIYAQLVEHSYEGGTNMDAAKGNNAERRELFLKQTHFSVNNYMQLHGNILT